MSNIYIHQLPIAAFTLMVMGTDGCVFSKISEQDTCFYSKE